MLITQIIILLKWPEMISIKLIKKPNQNIDYNQIKLISFSIANTDFAILHKTGYRQCQQGAIENTKYWREFTTTRCYQQSGN